MRHKSFSIFFKPRPVYVYKLMISLSYIMNRLLNRLFLKAVSLGMLTKYHRKWTLIFCIIVVSGFLLLENIKYLPT